MTQPNADQIYTVIEETWPSVSRTTVGPWFIRDGGGGGKRVSAATLDGQTGDIEQASAAMAALDQPSLFQVRHGQDDLDAALQASGHVVIDPTQLYVAALADMTPDTLLSAKTYAVWEPLQVMKDVWIAGGIGPARWAVMDRVTGPKTGIMGRFDDKIVGSAFVGIYRDIAMVHAVEVLEHARGNGVARMMMNHACHWAMEQGANWLAVCTVVANVPANALYSGMGMTPIGQYHYRLKDTL